MADPTHRAPSSPRSWPSMALPAAMGAFVFVGYAPGAGRALDFDSSQTVGSYIKTPSVLDAVRSQRLFNNHPAFSLIEHVVYTVTGSAEEWVLRLVPMVLAAATVAALVWVLQRHLGTLPAVCGGVYLATNPTVVELSRSVRGYSLLLLCGVVSSIALADLLGGGGTPTSERRWSAVYVASVAVGVATHLYMVPIVLGHIAVVLTRRSPLEVWVLRWLAGVGLGCSIYAAMLPDLLDALRAGSRTFKPRFPVDLAEVIVGSGVAAVLLGVVVALAALSVLRERRDLLVAGVTVGGAIGATWLVTASVHLEARFHVWLVPAAAVLAAVAVQRAPVLAVVVVTAGLVNAWSVRDGYVDDPNTQPELAALLDHARAEGDRGCVTSFSVLPILGYTRSFQPVVDPQELADCDVVAVPFPNLDGALAEAADAEMGVRVTYKAWFEDGLAFARDPAYFERLCAGRSSTICPP